MASCVAAAAPSASPAQALPALGADATAVSVSGISSGGFMAVQFQVAYSRQVIGAGIFAAGPYDCAAGSLLRALANCMAPGRFTPLPGTAETNARIDDYARRGLIDPPAALADDRAWVFGGGGDHTVAPPVVEALRAFYRTRLASGALRNISVPEAGHAMISVADPQANACASTEPPYINRCGKFDAAGDMLAFLLGARPLGKGGGQMQRFDQRPFIAGPAIDASLADSGYVFVPDACKAGGCALHVVFHGCHQGADEIGQRFVDGAGYKEWAERRRLVVLFPQAIARSGFNSGASGWVFNPQGCWDWWGYSGPDYATHQAPQMAAVHAMLTRLAEPAVRR